MMITESAANTRFSRKTLAVIFLILSFFVLIDVVISSLVDIYYDFTTSPAGKTLYVVVNIVLVVGTYIILKMMGNKIGGQSTKQTRENKIAKGVWAIYYLMIAIMAFVILQVLFFSEYYTGLLSIAPTISYGVAAFIMGLLAYHFFSWFARNKALVVLLYGLASVSSSIYVGLMVAIFYVEIFTNHPVVTTLESAGTFAPIDPGIEEILIVTLPGIVAVIIFLSLWGGTIVILYSNMKRIGKTRFWILVTTPIIFFMGSWITMYPEIQETPDDLNSIIIPVYLVTFSQVIAIALFSIAFISMARAIPHHQISDYMYITCFGLALFSIGTIATVSGAGYPPFGLPTVSLVGPFSFLLFIGLYHSAISTAEDSKLRHSTKVTAQQQLKLLHSIGTSEMERKLEKNILEVTKSNADNLMQQSGVEPTLTNEEVSNLIADVKKELHNKQ